MFAIYQSTPLYNNRDGYAGQRISRVEGYTYETAALALRKLPSEYDDEGEWLECTYFVADVSDPHRKPIQRPACPILDDSEIPF